eukprot:403335189
MKSLILCLKASTLSYFLKDQTFQYLPYIDPIQNKLEVFNEISILALHYMIILFTNGFPEYDSDLRYNMGYLMISLTVLSLFANSVVMIYYTQYNIRKVIIPRCKRKCQQKNQPQVEKGDKKQEDLVNQRNTFDNSFEDLDNSRNSINKNQQSFDDVFSVNKKYKKPLSKRLDSPQKFVKMKTKNSKQQLPSKSKLKRKHNTDKLLFAQQNDFIVQYANNQIKSNNMKFRDDKRLTLDIQSLRQVGYVDDPNLQKQPTYLGNFSRLNVQNDKNLESSQSISPNDKINLNQSNLSQSDSLQSPPGGRDSQE